jgi:PAS domain S-box-containing protein
VSGVVAPLDEPRPRWPRTVRGRHDALAVLVVASAYYAGAVVGLALRAPPAGIAITWPPNAILLAAFLLSPTRLWKWYLLAVLPTHLHVATTFQPLVPPIIAACQYLGNTGQALLAAWGLRKLSAQPLHFDALRGVGLFILVAALAAPVIASSGVISLFTWTGWVTDYWPAWRQRVLNNMATTLTLTPLVVLLFTSGLATVRAMSRARKVELLGLVLATFGVAAIFDSNAFGRDIGGSLLFAPVPLLLWAAVRFPPICLFVSLQVVMLALLVNAYLGRAPFFALEPLEVTLALQIFLIGISVPTILLMALMQEQERTARALSESQRRYGMATAAGANGVWEWNLATGALYIEPSLKALIGYADDEIANTMAAWSRHLEPRDEKDIRRQVDAYVSGRAPLYEVEHRAVHRDGSVRWLLCRGLATERVDGAVVRIAGTSTDITERKRAEEELRRSSERIRELAGRLISAQEEERRRVARDLHDDLNQKLAALSIGLSRARRRVPTSALVAHAEIELLQQRTSDLVSDVRALSHALHPVVLELNGLVPALAAFAAEMKRLESFDLELKLPQTLPEIPREVAVGLYRIAQESVRNAARHSGADRASLALTVKDHGVTLAVRDAGCGFDPALRNGGLGLVGIRERVNLLRGRLVLKSTIGRGTRLRVTVPLCARRGVRVFAAATHADVRV